MGIRKSILTRLGILNPDVPPRPASSFAGSKESFTPPPAPKYLSPEEALEAFAKETKDNPVFIYMKGSPKAPQCGFSAAVVDIFERLGFPYATRDVLADPTVRTEIKNFSDWPTIPQVYIGGEFVGGCDIVREMEQSGELQTALDAVFGKKPESPEPAEA